MGVGIPREFAVAGLLHLHGDGGSRSWVSPSSASISFWVLVIGMANLVHPRYLLQHFFVGMFLQRSAALGARFFMFLAASASIHTCIGEVVLVMVIHGLRYAARSAWAFVIALVLALPGRGYIRRLLAYYRHYIVVGYRFGGWCWVYRVVFFHHYGLLVVTILMRGARVLPAPIACISGRRGLR